MFILTHETTGYEPERLCHIYLFIYDIMFNFKNKNKKMCVEIRMEILLSRSFDTL